MTATPIQPPSRALLAAGRLMLNTPMMAFRCADCGQEHHTLYSDDGGKTWRCKLCDLKRRR